MNYIIYIYHVGEQRDEVLYAKTDSEALELGLRGEHSEIINVKTGELIQ